MGGWPVFKEAKAIHAAGRVSEATYEPPLLKGRITEGGRQFGAGLSIQNTIDVENLCPCRDSRVRGIICPHSVAVGLAILWGTREEKCPARGAVSGAPQVRNVEELTDEGPRVELALEGSLRNLEADVQFRYSRPGVRNPAKEAEVLTEMLRFGFAEQKGKAVLTGEEGVVKFFASELPRLRERWTVSEGERFLHVTRDIVRIEPQFAFRERSDGWLDFHVHFTAGNDALFTAQQVDELLRKGQSSVRLKDGRIAVADTGLAADLEEVLRDCNPKQDRAGYAIAPQFRPYLESSVDTWKGTGGTASGVSDSSDSPALGALAPRLRPYQVDGARWLLARAEARLGGLLADEMGLGKTVQALAMIEQLPGPVLVVCPSSLVWNWRREAERFLPGLPVLTLDGPDRAARFPELPASRLAVTSYALLRRDLDHYRGISFSAVLLDEAQHIKNPDSQNAKAAATLRAGSRFILTGTPVENSLRDLWSLFEFLLPGYLGSRNDFRDRYEQPLTAGATASVWQRLQRRLSPYLLRRRKGEILTELPDKIEQIIEVDLSPAQKAAYTQLQVAARSQLDALRESGGGAARMKVLTALLRLRQACCDVRLLGAPGDTESGKLTALIELLGEAIDGGHRVLVFSQFTSMLDLIAERLRELDIAHSRLDGTTKNRGDVVEGFQNTPAIPVFLISLKAGGVGLNLTAADTVIHFDPWWNPAVEAQATDRAHRIGQKNVVTSIKLIARDTVEERVLRMQEKKRDLLAGTVDADTALEALSAEEIGELVG